MFDKLFDYLCTYQNVDEYTHYQMRLKSIMDVLGETVFKQHIDASGRGFCYGWELYEYIKS